MARRAVTPRYLAGVLRWMLGLSLAAAAFPRPGAGSTFTLLHSFSGSAIDGAAPQAALTPDGSGNLYGTTLYGGAESAGILFTIKPDGSGFTILHSFSASPKDAVGPQGILILDGSGNLYGTTASGGANGGGVVYTIKTSGTGFTLLHSFSSSPGEGLRPAAGVVLDGAGNLFGTTLAGGDNKLGTVFTLTKAGTGFTLLHSFSDSTDDGVSPRAGVILGGDGFLYGTTPAGGANDSGTVFRVRTDGTDFEILHSFSSSATDGYGPRAGLVVDDAGILYGTTALGGDPLGGCIGGCGTIFSIRTDGKAFSLLHRFSNSSIDGNQPVAGLTLDAGGNLYGTTISGPGTDNYGTIFTIQKGGSGFALLHAFSPTPAEGLKPSAGVVLAGNGILVGTTQQGGASGKGTVFELNLTAVVFQPVVALPAPILSTSVSHR